MTARVFPRLVTLRIVLPDDLAERLRAFAVQRGWTLEEAVKILLAYAADLRMHAAGSEEDVFNEWSAARAEMALLRHRAYSADDSIQILEMNVTGLEASNAQFERSLPRVEAEVARLQAEVRDLEERCRWQSIPVPRMEPVRLRAEEELLAFFRRTSLRKDDADGNR